MTIFSTLIKSAIIILTILLVLTVAVPVSANETPENLNIDDMQENFYKSQSKNPSKILRTTDGKLFLINSENEERPEYFNWINDNDEFEVVFDENDNPLILIPIPYEHRPRITDSRWPLPCVQAPLPIIAIGGLYITLESIEILTATTVVAASIASSTTINMAEAFRVTNKIYKKGCNEFQRIAQFMLTGIDPDELNRYTFYKLDEPTFDELKEHTYHKLDKKKHVKDILTTQDAIDNMKDCGLKEVKGKPGVIYQKSVIRLFSTKDGCKSLSDYVTKLLGGTTSTFHKGRSEKLPHYHADMPLDKDGKFQHCNAHCYFKEPAHTEL